MNCTSYVKNGTNSIIHLKRPRASYLMQPTLNPDTHCTSCGEPLSEYDHCWQCHYPPMDPKQDAARSALPPKLTDPSHEHAPKQHQLHRQATQ